MLHTMTKINERDGQEEWICFSCGRHLLVRWTPELKTTVLVQGDSSVDHTGLRQNVPASAKRDVPAALLEDPRLKPWLAWMDEIDFENLWDSDVQES